jgi:hypothetical protein
MPVASGWPGIGTARMGSVGINAEVFSAAGGMFSPPAAIPSAMAVAAPGAVVRSTVLRSELGSLGSAAFRSQNNSDDDRLQARLGQHRRIEDGADPKPVRNDERPSGSGPGKPRVHLPGTDDVPGHPPALDEPTGVLAAGRTERRPRCDRVRTGVQARRIDLAGRRTRGLSRRVSVAGLDGMWGWGLASHVNVGCRQEVGPGR